MNISIKNPVRIFGIALAALVFLALPFIFASKVHAADFDVGGFDYIDTYTPDGSYYDGGGYDYIDTYTPDYSYDTGYYTGGYSYGGWSFGGGSSGYSSSYSSVYAPTNTCTATNSCNTTTQINAPTNIVTNYPPSQAVVYQQPNYSVYTPPVYTPPIYYPAQQRPVAYNTTPYVTLAAVPYTGLELGPWGTALYWGFLVLWCLLAAYLIVVKKIQNKIAAWFTGSATQNYASQKSSDLPSFGALRATPAGQTFVKHNSAPQFAGIDPFVLSQINRAK